MRDSGCIKKPRSFIQPLMPCCLRPGQAGHRAYGWKARVPGPPGEWSLSHRTKPLQVSQAVSLRRSTKIVLEAEAWWEEQGSPGEAGRDTGFQ